MVSTAFDEVLLREDRPDESVALDAMLDDAHPIATAASDWAKAHLEPLGHGIDRDRWRLLASAGFHGIVTPSHDGGSGHSTVEAMLLFEGLGHGCTDNGLTFALASQVFATQNAFRSAASPAQLDTHLPGLLAGDTFAGFAMTEPGAGSDSSAIRTTATRIDDHPDDAGHPGAVYELNGEKCWITLGPIADLIVVFATTDLSLGKWGITAFIVDTSHPGVTLGSDVRKLGLGSSPFGSIYFDRCRLTVDDRLGPQGAGGGIFTKAVEGERAFLFAGQLGSTKRVVEQAIQHARSDLVPGIDSATNQGVAHRIADMKLELEMARLLVYKAAALHDRGRSVGMASALAKLQTSEMAVTAALEAASMRGPAGYLNTSNGPDIDDALGGLAYSGTSDIQRIIIARLLRADAPLRPTRSRSAQSAVRPEPSSPTNTQSGAAEAPQPTSGHRSSGDMT